jgi:hypothetical protein
MKFVKMFVVVAVAVMAAGSAIAQDRVPGLQDLIGARGGDGEYQMEQRGYTWVRTEKSGGDAYSYWRENENGQCVVVRTSDGRYASIAYAPDFDCRGEGQDQGGHEGVSYDREDKFDSVCGVIVNGQTHRYKCRVVDFYSGREKVKTALHYPDMNVRLVWKGARNVVLHFDGMTPQQASYSSSEGETNFSFEGKTYFFISDKGAARMEVEHFHD